MTAGAPGRPARGSARSRWTLVWYWGPAVACMAAIFALSSLENLTTLPGGMSDKSGHLAGYALLGALVARALVRGNWRRLTFGTALTAWGICLAYGASDELHQWFVPGRTMAFDDWVADAAGSAVALVALGLLAPALGRRQKRTV